jgi:sortase A
MSDEVSLEPTRSSLRADAKKRRSRTVLGVTGEILITVGVLVQLFWLWNVGINDWIQGFTQTQAASTITQQWQEEASSEVPDAEGTPDSGISVYGTPVDGPPPIVDVVSPGTGFATLYVPRFGDTYQRVIAEGVDLATVLNDSRLGVGRYSQSTPLGKEGNFAIAGHRTSFGASFGNISELRLGDRLYIETREGWYSYAFRNLEYVWASEVEVLNPVPKQNAVEVTDRLLTLTSCHPRFSDAERIIAYAVFDGWYPRAGGPPAEIAQIVGVT